MNTLAILDRNTTSVTLSWNQPFDHKPEYTYKVALDGKLITFVNGNDFITVTHLNPGTKYMFSVFTLLANYTSDPVNIFSTTGEKCFFDQDIWVEL